ncbi:MAG: fimbrillin family protein [Bacteroidales bacterium]|nr:fimbrillin family protein [Bacteroidales bacterium]
MKKHILSVMALIVAFASCSKNEIQELPDVEISFSSPVVAPSTKANVTNKEMTSSYDTKEDFAVWAYAYDQATSDNNWTGGSVYMNDVTCTYNAKVDGTNPGWAPSTVYYWPKSHLLAFAAYSPAVSSGTKSYGTDGLTVKDFVTPEVGLQYDLMYSDRTSLHQACPTDNNTDGYHGVDLVFNHALSSIVVNVKLKDAYNTDSKKSIVVNEVSFKNVSWKGTFKENYGSNPSWTLSADGGTATYSPFADSQLAGVTNAQFTKGSNALMLIPQSIENIKLYVKYTLKGNSELVHEVELPITGSYENESETIVQNVIAWDCGKRYIYNIVIGLDKIHFAPSVTAWEDMKYVPNNGSEDPYNKNI